MNKKKIKYTLDAVMMILMILLMGYSITGNLWHEIIGVGLFLLFIIHNIINRKWFLNLGKIFKNENKNSALIIWNITDILLLIDMIILAISSIFLSKTIFAFAGLTGGYIWKYLHTICAYGGFIIMSMHLGCHWKMILSSFKKACKITEENKTFTIIFRILALIMSVLGVIASFKQNIVQKFIYTNNRNTEQQENYNVSYTESKINDNYINDDTSLNETIDDGETLNDFLNKLVCTGCGKNCSLLSPSCHTGESLSNSAQSYYEEQTSSDSSTNTIVYNNNYINSSNTTSENNGSFITIGYSGKNEHGNSNEKHNKNKQRSNEKSKDSTNSKEHNNILIEGDDNLLSLFTDYIPISGLYVCGTYYVLELIRKNKKKS